MWSDPIDNALAQVDALLSGRNGDPRNAPSGVVAATAKAVARARKIRAAESKHDRLVTPEDRW